MRFRQYLSSRVFVAQMIAAISIIVVLSYFFFHWLTFTTNHGQEITVPNLSKLSVEQAEERLAAINLNYVILDTVDFNAEYPKLTIVDQEPKPNSKVKEGRKIYIKINASTYTTVSVPDLIEKTYRQAVPTLEAGGLKEGNISYRPYIGKDMVLEMRMNGVKLKPGEKVLKFSKIDLVLGDGKAVFDETYSNSTEVDSTDTNINDEP